MIGKTISHYKILEKLGEGGMGVVYKAEDIKLERTVALKFLPPHLSNQEKEKKRFIHEAKAASALEHNNICTIHEIDETEEGQLFIVMSYLEGKTLQEKIDISPLKIDEAIGIAIQTAEGLKLAHEKGIVHRDIKPANLMITTDSTVKIMDFGLAKFAGKTKLTQKGTTLGTFSYMSPEQSRGGEVDYRTDIWSLGVVLYEMLTGQLPFKGEYEQAVIYSLMNVQQEPITSLRSNMPLELERIVNKTLAKEPDERYQHIDELIADLKIEQKNLEYARIGYNNVSTIKHISKEKSFAVRIPKQKAKLKIIIPSIIVVLLAVTFLFLQKGTPELNPDMTFRTIKMPLDEFQYPGLSEDGKWIVFPAADANNKWDIYWMHNSGGEARRVTFDSSDGCGQGCVGADISPDGGEICYSRYNAKSDNIEICVVSSNGGTGRKIVDKGSNPKWSPDGKRIGFVVFSVLSKSGWKELHSIKSDGSDEQVLFIDSLSKNFGNISFSWSPDGKSIAWDRTFPDLSTEVITHNLETGEEKQLTHDGKNIDEVFWAKNNMIIFSSTKSGNTNLWCVPAGGGDELQITKGSGPDLAALMSADCKKLLYFQYQELGNIWSANGSGSDLHQLTFDNQNIGSLCLSPDGKYIVFTILEDKGVVKNSSHLYVMNSDGTGRRQLTFGNNSDSQPSFSPDGKHLTYSSYSVESIDSLKVQIKMIDFPNPGTPKVLHTGWYARWNNNTEMIVFAGFASWKLSTTSNSVEKFFRDSTYAFPVVNGKRILYIDRTKAHSGLWLRIKESGKDLLIHKSKDFPPFIAAPGQQFTLYKAEDDKIWKVNLSNGKKEILSNQLPGVRYDFSVSFSSDGKKIVFINTQPRSRFVMIDNPFK